MFFKHIRAILAKNEASHSFPAPEPNLPEIISKRFRYFVVDYAPLFEATCVAISAHILAFPLAWFIGWALPWPKSPEIRTIIEFDLSNWPEEAVPKEITDIYESHKKGKFKSKN